MKYTEKEIEELMRENHKLNNNNRILGVYDDILDKKYFILNKNQHAFRGVVYFYNTIENFFINEVLKNKGLLTLDVTGGNLFLDNENYKIYKMINYDNIIETLKLINSDFKNSYKDFIEYTLEDFYIVLDYIQERSMYLSLRL